MKIFSGILICITVTVLNGQQLDDQIILPPMPSVEREEIWDKTDLESGSPIDTTQKKNAEINLEDIIIYGEDQFKHSPGKKVSKEYIALLLPQYSTKGKKRDNLYDKLPRVENKFLLSRDWNQSKSILSKALLTYGAWNTLGTHLVLGKQNVRLRNNRTIDLFIDFRHTNSDGHEDKKQRSYINDYVKGSSLYEVEPNVELQSSIYYEKYTVRQPSLLENRTLTNYTFLNEFNSYNGAYASNEVTIDLSTGSLQDTGKITFTSTYADWKPSRKFHDILVTGGITLLSHRVQLPSDSLPDKSKYAQLVINEEGWIYNDVTVHAGLSLIWYKSGLGRDQWRLFPNINTQYSLNNDMEMYLSFNPAISFQSFPELIRSNKYLSENIEIMPLEKYVDITAGAEYRLNNGITLHSQLGHVRYRNYKLYSKDAKTTTKPSLFTLTASGTPVQINKLAMLIRTGEWYNTSLESKLKLRFPSFVTKTGNIPYIPLFTLGLEITGNWIPLIESKVFLHYIGSRYGNVNTSTKLAPYSVLNIDIAYDIGNDFKLFLHSLASLIGSYEKWEDYSEQLFFLSMGVRYKW